ncbi:MAG: FAD-binding oxidoreductase [Rhodovibrionaceae bacterium]
MIENEAPELANSLWSATANPHPNCPPLRDAIACDIAIVGGGFTGLSCALHLAERGEKPLLLEAEAPGWGASGRNGGQVIPGLKEDPDSIEAAFAGEAGARMVALAGGAPDLVFDLIRRHGIDCDARRNGWIQPAHSLEALKLSEARVEQWGRRGAPIELLDATAAESLLGCSGYHGGLLDRRGGGLHPLNYALGLAHAAQALGARLHGASPVLSLEREQERYLLKTPGGEVTARRVALCTNGYTSNLIPELRRSVLPLRSLQVATEALPEASRRSILPQGQVASDTRPLLSYFRLDAEGRFMIGGRGAERNASVAKRLRALRGAAQALFPQLGAESWRYHWGGLVALTPDHYPHLHEPLPGLVAALGYNGRGVAMATAMGRVLADKLTGSADTELDFPVTALQPIPFHGLRRPVIAAAMAWQLLRARLNG